MRAILKGDAMCAVEPERSAKLLMDKGITTQYEYALQMMKQLPYGKWREYDPDKLTPMMVKDVDTHFYVNELTQCSNGSFVIPVRWVMKDALAHVRYSGVLHHRITG